jgi:hypothetical protein
MLKKILGCSSLRLLALLAVVLFLYGCETLNGMKRDMDIMMGWDKEFQEAYW